MSEDIIVNVPTHFLKKRILNVGQTLPQNMSNKELLEHIRRDPGDKHLADELFRRKLHINCFLKD